MGPRDKTHVGPTWAAHIPIRRFCVDRMRQRSRIGQPQPCHSLATLDGAGQLGVWASTDGPHADRIGPSRRWTAAAVCSKPRPIHTRTAAGNRMSVNGGCHTGFGCGSHAFMCIGFLKNTYWGYVGELTNTPRSVPVGCEERGLSMHRLERLCIVRYL